LAFEELDPVVAVEVDGRRATVDLDTESTFTQMWPPLARRFPNQVHKGRKNNASLSGATGSADVESVVVPELRMTVAGFPMALRDLNCCSLKQFGPVTGMMGCLVRVGWRKHRK
jgi:hypothetical protein